jgi:hypothetical protein
VDRHRADAVLRQLLGEPVGAVLGAREHEHLEPVVLADQMREQLALAIAIDRVDLLRDGFRGRVAACDFDQRRRIEQAVGERLDLVGEGRREQQVLTPRRQLREHALDVVDEAHVEHPVRFVEHEDVEIRQVDRLLHVVEQAARRRDDDVDAALERRSAD